LNETRKGTLLSLSSALLGAAFLVPYKAAGQLAPVRGVVLAMLVAAAAFNTVTLYGRPGERARRRRIDVAVALALSVCTVVGNIASLAALALLEPAIVSATTHTQVFLVVALAWPLLGERPTARFVAGAAIAVAGFVLMQRPTAGGTVTTAGIGLAVLAAGMWASMQVITRWAVARIDLVFVNGLRLWLASAALACVPGAIGSARAMPAEAWALAGCAAFLGPFLSRVALMYSVRYISASHSTLVGLIGPAFALLFGLAAFGTAPSPLEIAGGAVILTGVSLPLFELAGRTR
jgi:drug/metabolite transporter (DMT)-like permease